MLPPSDPRWTDVRPPGVSRPPRVPPDDVYPIGTDHTITPRRDRPLRTPKMAKVEVDQHGQFLKVILAHLFQQVGWYFRAPMRKYVDLAQFLFRPADDRTSTHAADYQPVRLVAPG